MRRRKRTHARRQRRVAIRHEPIGVVGDAVAADANVLVEKQRTRAFLPRTFPVQVVVRRREHGPHDERSVQLARHRGVRAHSFELVPEPGGRRQPDEVLFFLRLRVRVAERGSGDVVVRFRLRLRRRRLREISERGEEQVLQPVTRVLRLSRVRKPRRGRDERFVSLRRQRENARVFFLLFFLVEDAEEPPQQRHVAQTAQRERPSLALALFFFFRVGGLAMKTRLVAMKTRMRLIAPERARGARGEEKPRARRRRRRGDPIEIRNRIKSLRTERRRSRLGLRICLRRVRRTDARRAAETRHGRRVVRERLFAFDPAQRGSARAFRGESCGKRRDALGDGFAMRRGGDDRDARRARQTEHERRAEHHARARLVTPAERRRGIENVEVVLVALVVRLRERPRRSRSLLETRRRLLQDGLELASTALGGCSNRDAPRRVPRRALVSGVARGRGGRARVARPVARQRAARLDVARNIPILLRPLVLGRVRVARRDGPPAAAVATRATARVAASVSARAHRAERGSSTRGRE